MEDFAKELQSVNAIVVRLMNTVNSCIQHIDELASQKESDQFDIVGSVREGSLSGIIYLPSGEGADDPLGITVKFIVKRNKTPSILFGNATIEDSSLARRAVHVITARLKTEKTGSFVIVLTWDVLIPPLEKARAVILGRRYFYDPTSIVSTLVARLSKKGIMIETDEHQYGGSSITYNLCHELEQSDVAVCEITVSESFAKDKKKVASLIEALYD
ncbi:MAG: hypothetical protein K9W43_02780 [Candidatus Thorarchaeota archaeon]|nr:hypothetical protein [Candidatus Thorarchaeota archaeon]